MGNQILNNSISAAFLELLRAGLWNSKVDLNKISNLSEANWVSLYLMAHHQTVEAIIGNEVQKLPEAYLPPKSILLKWMVRVQQIKDSNERMNISISNLFEFFKSYGLHPVLQKGQGIASYYNHPELRNLGDIDVYFGNEDHYFLANKLINEQVDDFTYSSGYSSHYTWEGFIGEHHKRFFNLRNPFIMSYLKTLEYSETQKTIDIQLSGSTIQIPSIFLNTIMVNVHVLSHQVGYGIGIRQLCDASRLYYANKGQFDSDKLDYIYRKLGVRKWINMFHSVLVDLVGLDEDYLPLKLNRRSTNIWMMEDILRGGNFSFYDARYNDQSRPYGRVNRVQRLFYGFKKYLPLAPTEAIAFPIMHIISKVHR